MAQFPKRRNNAVLSGIAGALVFAIVGGVFVYSGQGVGTSDDSKDVPSDKEVIEAMKKYYRDAIGPNKRKSARVFRPRPATGKFKGDDGEPVSETRIVVPCDEREVSSGARHKYGYSLSRNKSGKLEVNLCSILADDEVRWIEHPCVSEAIANERPIWSFGD